jgi:hypothetical protein
VSPPQPLFQFGPWCRRRHSWKPRPRPRRRPRGPRSARREPPGPGRPDRAAMPTVPLACRCGSPGEGSRRMRTAGADPTLLPKRWAPSPKGHPGGGARRLGVLQRDYRIFARIPRRSLRPCYAG